MDRLTKFLPVCLLCHASGSQLYFQKTDPMFGPRDYYHCPVCGLIYLSPGQQLDFVQQKQRYDWHENNTSDIRYIRFLKKLTDPLGAYLSSGAKGLDYGCGPGPAIWKILEESGCFVTNYDPIYCPNQSALEQKYDFIVCTEVIEHFYNPRIEFLKFKFLLKEEQGILAVMTEVLGDPVHFSQWWYHREPTHMCFYQVKTFQWIAGWLGWSVQFFGKNVAIFFEKTMKIF